MRGLSNEKFNVLILSRFSISGREIGQADIFLKRCKFLSYATEKFRNICWGLSFVEVRKPKKIEKVL